MTVSNPMPRILLVEDEFLIRLTLAEVLIDDGFKVIEAADGDEAIRLLETTPCDLLVTDLNLPGTIDGLALMRRARVARRDLPVIITSGRMDIPADVADPLLVRMSKPYQPTEICAVARRLTGR